MNQRLHELFLLAVGLGSVPVLETGLDALQDFRNKTRNVAYLTQISQESAGCVLSGQQKIAIVDGDGTVLMHGQLHGEKQPEATLSGTATLDSPQLTTRFATPTLPVTVKQELPLTCNVAGVAFNITSL